MKSMKKLAWVVSCFVFSWNCWSQEFHPITNVIQNAANPLPLSAVRITGGPLKVAQDLDIQYLLKLEPDRMLSYFRKNAGLEPRARGYGGWDGDGKNLTGHILGHYLSAISLMYAATGDVRFKERVNYIINELKVVQDANGDGYLGALFEGKKRFEEVANGNIRSGGFDLNGLWSPWYVLHKVFAGLRDAHHYAGNREALVLEVKFAAWAERILSGLSEEQVQRMLNTEFGGMNEVLADLYADTGDKRWLALSCRFEHQAVLTPLKRHQDCLAGLHGNTQIPKLLGSLARFSYTGDPGDGFAAGFFFDRVVMHHSYATGGNGKDEYFGEPDKLSDRVDGRTAETCNVYNMLKMERKLFALRPDAYYAEFQERALFNHILASMDPQDGRMCYMVPVGRGVKQEYQDMFESFTCCVGTGMESHALHGDGIYYENGNRLWVNLFVPSTAQWKNEGVTLEQKTDFPEGGSASLKLSMAGPRPLTLALRRPSWAGNGFWVKVNGGTVTNVARPGNYVEVSRMWNDGDVIELNLPKSLRLEPTPDNPHRAAILWGPLVLAGDLGDEDFSPWKPGAVPVLVASGRAVSDWLKPVDGQPGNFRSVGVGRDRDVDFKPFYRTHRRTYAIYWDFYSPQEWEKCAAEHAAEMERQRRLALATVAFAQPGEMQPERDYHEQGEQSDVDRVMGRPCRRGRAWFSFDMPVEPAHSMSLVITYYSDEWRKRSFDILVDGTHVASQVVEKNGSPHFFDVEYALPAGVVKGKKTVTVRFEAAQGSEIAAVFGIRMIRADAGK